MTQTPPASEQPATGRDFIDTYLQYTTKTECPVFYNRWVAVTCLAAYLEKRVHFNFGHFKLHPNIYAMLIGSPGTKKSSAIKIGTALIKKAGYKTFAAKKTRQEKYLLDLSEQAGIDDGTSVDDMLDENLWGDGEATSSSALERHSSKPPTPSFIAADEFNNFIGIGNMDFISILGDLWDIDEVYEYRLKNSKSIYIPYPIISILGGNTPTGFSQAFPVDSIGQGFFSRLLLVYGEPSGVKYTFPPPPDLQLQGQLVSLLGEIKQVVVGQMTMTPEAEELIDLIYKSWRDLEDLRFENYSNRRLPHLIKLAMVVTASRVATTITLEDIVRANTLLSFTESLMPKALGEFGKSRHSITSHKVMTIINKARDPISFIDLWKACHNDLENRQILIEIIGNLEVANKIQVVSLDSGGGGYLPIKAIREDDVNGSTNYEKYLTKYELEMI